ncbi:MAG: signal peptidase II [Myxococcota bacterium]
MSPKLRILLVLVGIVLPLDQLTKLLIERYVSPYEPITVIDGFFRITHATNPGMAFGLLQHVHVGFFIVLTLVALGLIGSFYRSLARDDRFGSASLALILAGALGNLIDRVFRESGVVDFLQFDLGLFIFPDFNVADSAIVIGVGLLLFELVVSETEEAAGQEGES